KRAENFGRRQQSLDEIASDLARVEAQIDLVLENTTLQGKPQAASLNLELASQALDFASFGSSAADVADVDAPYSQPPPTRDRPWATVTFRAGAASSSSCTRATPPASSFSTATSTTAFCCRPGRRSDSAA